jgi:hypothetical protein
MCSQKKAFPTNGERTNWKNNEKEKMCDFHFSVDFNNVWAAAAASRKKHKAHNTRRYELR